MNDLDWDGNTADLWCVFANMDHPDDDDAMLNCLLDAPAGDAPIPSGPFSSNA